MANHSTCTKKIPFLNRIFLVAITLSARPCFAQPGDSLRDILALPGTQRSEMADFNFDGYTDYRIGTVKYTKKFDYFLYNKERKKFEKDTFLSSLEDATFDFGKKTFLGYRTSIINKLTTQTDLFVYRDSGFVLFQRAICTLPNEQSERIDCTFYEMINGQLVFREFIRGKE